MALTIREKIKVLETVENLYEMIDSRVDMAKTDYEENKRCLEENPEDESYKRWTQESKMEKEAWEIIREAVEGIDRTIKM